MAPYHNNKLKMVGLFNSDETHGFPSTLTNILPSTTDNNSGVTSADNGYLHAHEPSLHVKYGFGGNPLEPERFIDGSRANQAQEQEGHFGAEHSASSMSYTPSDDSDEYQSADEEVTEQEMPKKNKDGALRKPRQPRSKLLKWSDNDWKNVVLGIIWACGENGVQIPFNQAAQLVGENCTASALQQAVLKLRSKQIAEGHQIPSLKMAWTRKNKNKGSPSPVDNAKSAQAPMKAAQTPNKSEQAPVKNSTLKRVFQKAKSSLLVKLKVGRRGKKNVKTEAHVLPMKGMQPKTSRQFTNATKPEAPKKSMNGMQPENYMPSVNDVQPETVMQSMNGINSMQSEALTLPFNMQNGGFTLSADDMQPGGFMMSADEMQPGSFTMPADDMQFGGLMMPADGMQFGGLMMPINNLSSGMPTPAYGAQSHQPFHQHQLQDSQPPLSLSYEAKRYNRNHVMVNNFVFDEYGNIKGTASQPQIAPPEAKSYNRNHAIFNDYLVDGNGNVKGTDQDFHPFENIVTPEINHPHGLTHLQTEGVMLSYDMYNLSDAHSQKHKLPDHL